MIARFQPVYRPPFRIALIGIQNGPTKLFAHRYTHLALPWPWDGEWFAVDDVPRLAFITGPLGSGKTRFARRFAAALPDAVFLGLDRLSDPTVARRLADDAVLAEQVERRLTWLVEDGAERPDALMAHLRLRGTSKRALILMTRSSLNLDLDALEQSEVVIHCPANHSVPLRVVPYPGGQGYEAVATCVAPPKVRARTAGTVAQRRAPTEV